MCGEVVKTNVVTLQQVKERPKISVVMVSYMTGPALFESVRAVLEDRDIHELILVDNGSSESSRQSVHNIIAQNDRVKILQGQGNVGFAKGCNYGASFARGELLLFLNPDAIISLGSARRLADCGMTMKAPWIVGGLLRDVHGQEQRGARRRELTPLSAFLSFSGLHKLPGVESIHMDNEPVPSSPEDVAVVSGAFMMMCQNTFDQIDGFDEDFFLHVEDIDVCRRTRESGGKVVFHPKATVMHYGSTSKVRRQKVEWEKLKGFIHYFNKYANGFFGKLLTFISIPFMTLAIMGRAWYLEIRKVFKGS